MTVVHRCAAIAIHNTEQSSIQTTEFMIVYFECMRKVRMFAGFEQNLAENTPRIQHTYPDPGGTVSTSTCAKYATHQNIRKHTPVIHGIIGVQYNTNTIQYKHSTIASSALVYMNTACKCNITYKTTLIIYMSNMSFRTNNLISFLPKTGAKYVNQAYVSIAFARAIFPEIETAIFWIIFIIYVVLVLCPLIAQMSTVISKSNAFFDMVITFAPLYML